MFPIPRRIAEIAPPLISPYLKDRDKFIPDRTRVEESLVIRRSHHRRRGQGLRKSSVTEG